MCFLNELKCEVVYLTKPIFYRHHVMRDYQILVSSNPPMGKRCNDSWFVIDFSRKIHLYSCSKNDPTDVLRSGISFKLTKHGHSLTFNFDLDADPIIQKKINFIPV